MLAPWQDMLAKISGDVEILLLLLVSLALSACIGFDRESRNRPAGLRTHVLVGLGSTLFVCVGELLVFETGVAGEYINHDPARILEAVITGVAFLGAGTIFFARGQATVAGLTTAASLWLTSGIGMAVGLNHIVLAVGSTIMGVAILRFLYFGAASRAHAPDEPTRSRHQ